VCLLLSLRIVSSCPPLPSYLASSGDVRDVFVQDGCPLNWGGLLPLHYVPKVECPKAWCARGPTLTLAVPVGAPASMPFGSTDSHSPHSSVSSGAHQRMLAASHPPSSSRPAVVASRAPAAPFVGAPFLSHILTRPAEVSRRTRFVDALTADGQPLLGRKYRVMQ
jgi:hypothetical protein